MANGDPSVIAVCSWSLQATSVAELEAGLRATGTRAVAVACGDPKHGVWTDGDAVVDRLAAADLDVVGAMIGFPGEDYATPASFHDTVGLAPVELRAERLELLRWAVGRARDLGATELTFHFGAVPGPRAAGREAFMAVLDEAAGIARSGGVALCAETGPDEPALLAGTLLEVGAPELLVNFDPANLIDCGFPDVVDAAQVLGPLIGGVHVKDAVAPVQRDVWGEERPLGEGDVPWPAVLAELGRAGYAGPLCIEREAGAPEARVAEIAAAVRYVRELIARA